MSKVFDVLIFFPFLTKHTHYFKFFMDRQSMDLDIMYYGGEEMGNSPKLEQNKTNKRTSSSGKIASIGFFAGLIWSIVGWLAYYLNFTKVGPALILEPWALGKWKEHLSGQLLGILVISIVSVIIAFLYRLGLAKIRTLWFAILFGLILWVMVFYILQPWIPHLKPVTKLGKDTISTTLCLFSLYGLFLGYSISFEVNELVNQKNQKNYSNK